MSPFYFNYTGAANHPPCINSSQLVFAQNGQLEVMGTFAKCLQNVEDPLLFPGYYSGNIVTVTAQVALNNLAGISELDNTVTFDYFFR